MRFPSFSSFGLAPPKQGREEPQDPRYAADEPIDGEGRSAETDADSTRLEFKRASFTQRDSYSAFSSSDCVESSGRPSSGRPSSGRLSNTASLCSFDAGRNSQASVCNKDGAKLISTLQELFASALQLEQQQLDALPVPREGDAMLNVLSGTMKRIRQMSASTDAVLRHCAADARQARKRILRAIRGAIEQARRHKTMALLGMVQAWATEAQEGIRFILDQYSDLASSLKSCHVLMGSEPDGNGLTQRQEAALRDLECLDGSLEPAEPLEMALQGEGDTFDPTLEMQKHLRKAIFCLGEAGDEGGFDGAGAFFVLGLGGLQQKLAALAADAQCLREEILTTTVKNKEFPREYHDFMLAAELCCANVENLHDLA